jgi:Protein of unknown function (DUF2829)
MSETYADPRDYAKDRVHHVGFPEAIQRAHEGWVISREGWGHGTIVFFAKEGSFTAADLVTGTMLGFLVVRSPSGTYVPWSPSQVDIHAIDWACISRQTFQRQMPEREAAVGQKNVPEGQHVDWKDVRSEGSPGPSS